MGQTYIHLHTIHNQQLSGRPIRNCFLATSAVCKPEMTPSSSQAASSSKSPKFGIQPGRYQPSCTSLPESSKKHPGPPWTPQLNQQKTSNSQQPQALADFITRAPLSQVVETRRDPVKTPPAAVGQHHPFAWCEVARIARDASTLHRQFRCFRLNEAQNSSDSI